MKSTKITFKQINLCKLGEKKSMFYVQNHVLYLIQTTPDIYWTVLYDIVNSFRDWSCKVGVGKLSNRKKKLFILQYFYRILFPHFMQTVNYVGVNYNTIWDILAIDFHNDRVQSRKLYETIKFMVAQNIL